MKPAPIRLQKHIVVDGDNLGKMNPCPIEYRNIFIKELGPDETASDASPLSRSHRRQTVGRGPTPRSGDRSYELLKQIDATQLPDGYEPATHQDFVDRCLAELRPEQRARIGRLWQEKQKIDPDMPNRGSSFVKIMMYVAEGKTRSGEDNRR